MRRVFSLPLVTLRIPHTAALARLQFWPCQVGARALLSHAPGDFGAVQARQAHVEKDGGGRERAHRVERGGAVARDPDGVAERLVERLCKLRAGPAPAVGQPTLPPRDAGPRDRLSFTCPGCGRRVKIKPELAGKKIKCPRCAHVITIPAMETETLEEVSGPAAITAKPPTRKVKADASDEDAPTTKRSKYKPCPRCGEVGAKRVMGCESFTWVDSGSAAVRLGPEAIPEFVAADIQGA